MNTTGSVIGALIQRYADSGATTSDHDLRTQLFSFATAILVAMIGTASTIWINRRPRQTRSTNWQERAQKLTRQLAARDRFLAALGFDGARITRGDEDPETVRFRRRARP